MEQNNKFESTLDLPDSVKQAFQILLRDHPFEKIKSSGDTRKTSYPDRRNGALVIHGFIDVVQINALMSSGNHQGGWREATWRIFNALVIPTKHLQNVQFIALLHKSGVLKAICAASVFANVGAAILAADVKKSPHALAELVSELTPVQLRAAFFVWFYFTICYSDSVIWSAITNELGSKSGFLRTSIFELERRIDNLALCLARFATVHVENMAIKLLYRLIDHVNRQFEKPILVMPAPTIFMTSRDDALNPGHALYASAGSAFWRAVDSQYVKLLLQPSSELLVTALQCMYMSEFLVDEKVSRRWLQIPFTQFSFKQDILIACVSAGREICLSDKTAGIWLMLCKRAFKRCSSVRNHCSQDTPWERMSPEILLQLDNPTTAYTKRGFRKRYLRLLNFLAIDERYIHDLLRHPAAAFGGALQQRVSGMTINYLRNPSQTKCLPAGEPGCWEIPSNGCVSLASGEESDSGLANQDGNAQSVEYISAVDIVLNYRDWLLSSKGIGVTVANLYERSLATSCPQLGVEILLKNIAEIKCNDLAWSCVLSFIHSKVQALSQKLQTKQLKKVGELKPIFEYFLPSFDFALTQITWPDASSNFDMICKFYEQMLSARGEQHSVRGLLGHLVMDFHNNFFIKREGVSDTSKLKLDREDLNLSLSPNSKIRVHYAPPSSYRSVLDAIGIQYDYLDVLERESMCLLHILLYRLTLRRGEVLALRLGDFQWSGFDPNDAAKGLCQLRIRGAHLKSVSAQRMITLNGLLDDHELALVHKRYTDLRQLNNWHVEFFILDPIPSHSADKFFNPRHAGQTQLDRLLRLWRKLPRMQTFTVHSYRHCAINNAFVHLVLSSLDEQRRATSRLPWMRDPEFSNERNLSVTQSITAVPVNSGARPLEIAFELIRFCGHLHFRTTRHTYLHLMNWACMVALNQAHEICVSKADWGDVLGLRDRANKSQRENLMREYSISGDLDPGAPSLRLLVVRVVRALKKLGALA